MGKRQLEPFLSDSCLKSPLVHHFVVTQLAMHEGKAGEIDWVLARAQYFLVCGGLLVQSSSPTCSWLKLYLMSEIIFTCKLFSEVEMNSGRLFQRHAQHGDEYSKSHYSPKLKRIRPHKKRIVYHLRPRLNFRPHRILKKFYLPVL